MKANLTNNRINEKIITSCNPENNSQLQVKDNNKIENIIFSNFSSLRQLEIDKIDNKQIKI